MYRTVQAAEYGRNRSHAVGLKNRIGLHQQENYWVIKKTRSPKFGPFSSVWVAADSGIASPQITKLSFLFFGGAKLIMFIGCPPVAPRKIKKKRCYVRWASHNQVTDIRGLGKGGRANNGVAAQR
jgi:hypothetical protein